MTRHWTGSCLHTQDKQKDQGSTFNGDEHSTYGLPGCRERRDRSSTLTNGQDRVGHAGRQVSFRSAPPRSACMAWRTPEARVRMQHPQRSPLRRPVIWLLVNYISSFARVCQHNLALARAVHSSHPQRAKGSWLDEEAVAKVRWEDQAFDEPADCRCS